MANNTDEKVATIGPPPSNRRVLLRFTSEYTHANAYNCALLSNLAYGKAADITEFFRQVANTGQRVFVYDQKKEVRSSPFFGCEEPFVFDPKNFHSSGLVTQFYIASNANQVIVSVRGTESVPDWITDAYATLVPFPAGPANAQVHKGFYDAFLFVKDKLDQYAARTSCANKEFIVTGHSMGGAVATLVAAYLKETRKFNVLLYTYGSPRVGNKTFAQHYSPNYLWHHRIVNGGDIVTMVPLPGMDLRPYLCPLLATPLAPTILPLMLLDFSGDPYTHCGQLHHIEASGNVAPDGGIRQIEAANWGRTATLRNLPLGLTTNAVFVNQLINLGQNAVDHFITNYVSLLKRALLLDANSYLAAPTAEHGKVDADVAVLGHEVSVLEASRIELLHEAALQIQPKKALLEFEAAKLNLIIADKQVDLSHYAGVAHVYNDMAKHKQRFIELLFGRNSINEPNLETELQWHATH